MASSSQQLNNGVNHDAIPTSPPPEHGTVPSPVDNNDQTLQESDPRDGRETSISSEEGDGVQILTECQSGKCPQNTQKIPVDRARPIVPPSNPDLATVLEEPTLPRGDIIARGHLLARNM
ncbi:hypothetical protein A2U01_0042482, partial [Trifolium medium]|nr:hypothetical protein [Trifolium medium]